LSGIDGGMIEHMTHLMRMSIEGSRMKWHDVRVKDTHDDGSRSMSTLVLSEVVRSGKFLATFETLEWLLMGVKRSVVSLQVLLSPETT